ncbi:NAD-dependent epimerase/dehydratase family protein [Halalkalibacter alkalisediminis]|uniref:NAD-dependent epimerase/dehydratase family protein n=1 Tax=Halalkalibacter alkalisediminis TaxID=935616 RepID=A0ABV6NDN6_9BACI|nr:NAD(P)-dependent oxidoreductase [Halalkalibacter alkalisediminis]
MKKIVIIGGAGTVGIILTKAFLKNEHQVVIMDQQKNEEVSDAHFIEVDATNLHELTEKVPEADVLINLLNTETSHAIDEVETFEHMTDIFFKATYYILHTATLRKIPKVIFASTNHVTDFYEENGNSLLGREINVNDVPCSRGLYGVLKFASEQIGFLFSAEEGISVMNIRIGSVPKDVSKEDVEANDRLKKTLLTDTDLIGLFTSAIDSNLPFGTYYGVSDNPGKPWDMLKAKTELGYRSMEDTTDIL